ncbi:hypothetical protein HQ533_03495 [Candidatus Woesearchaeota archaeon]|nr:hypothetical protein [Candidatus Woesearchaeota archaeon]
MDTQLLEEIGLTKSETNVYLALLELGSTTTGKIVDKSRASSSKIYEILDRLMQKGLVSFIIKSGVKYFEAAPPERILDYIEEKEKQLQEKKDQAKKIIPQLTLRKELSKYQSEATIYKGFKGLETAFNDIFNVLGKGDTVYVYVVGELDPKINDLIIKQYKERAKRGIRTKTIFSETGRKLYESRKNIDLFEAKILPSESPSPATINIYGNKVLIRMGYMDNMITVIINNKSCAESFMQQFNTLWNQRVQTYEGQEAVEQVFTSLVDKVTSKDEVIVFAAKPTTKRGSDYNVLWNINMRKKAKSVKLLYYGYTKENKERAKEISSLGCETKIIPTQETLSISTVVMGDTILNTVWGESPTVFKIQNKTVADSLRENFEFLWNQDVIVHKGFDNVMNKFRSMLDYCNEKEGYCVLSASTPRQTKKERQWFMDYHKTRIEKKIPIKLLCNPDYTEELKNRQREAGDEYFKITEIKSLTKESTNPMQINLYPPNKVLMFLWDKETVCFEMESETLYENFKTYFNTLWNQDARVSKGINALNAALDNYLDGLESEETYDVLGATYGIKDYSFHNKRYAHAFRRIHEKRTKRGIKTRLLFQQRKNKVVQKFLDTIYCENKEAKILPFKTDFPVAILPSKNSTLIIIHKKEPTMITINNRETSQAFQKYFDSMWNQDTRIVKGLDAIQNLFEEMLDAGSCDLIGARGYFVDKRPKYIDEWEKRAIKKGFKMRNIVDKGIKGHRNTKFPFVKTKYTLPKEFANLSVVWIYGDKVAISNWTEKEPIAVIIENKSLHDMYKTQFELLWNKKII